VALGAQGELPGINLDAHTRQEQHHKQTITRTNAPTPHSTTLKGGATTVRATCGQEK